MTANFAYRGRFAPSPTGPLHLGSLVAALGSWLDARSQGGQWLLRLEDLDTERNQPGAESAILHCLEGFGLHWDGPVLRQQERLALYQATLDSLLRNGQAYPCACSRKDVLTAETAAGVTVYPGTCRAGLKPGQTNRSFRFKVNEMKIVFNDELKGDYQQDLARDVGDFVIKRADGPFAYQLAVVVDDGDQGITHVVRGADLLDSTPRQIALQQALGLPTPRYRHLPLVRNTQGEKLSKQTLAPAVTPDPSTLRQALALLGIAVPAEAGNNLNSILDYALQQYVFINQKRSD